MPLLNINLIVENIGTPTEVWRHSALRTSIWTPTCDRPVDHWHHWVSPTLKDQYSLLAVEGCTPGGMEPWPWCEAGGRCSMAHQHGLMLWWRHSFDTWAWAKPRGVTSAGCVKIIYWNLVLRSRDVLFSSLVHIATTMRDNNISLCLEPRISDRCCPPIEKPKNCAWIVLKNPWSSGFQPSLLWREKEKPLNLGTNHGQAPALRGVYRERLLHQETNGPVLQLILNTGSVFIMCVILCSCSRITWDTETITSFGWWKHACAIVPNISTTILVILKHSSHWFVHRQSVLYTIKPDPRHKGKSLHVWLVIHYKDGDVRRCLRKGKF